MNTLVSIIVPVYNVENYLKQCLDSIKNQTYQYLEILLVNDEVLTIRYLFVWTMLLMTSVFLIYIYKAISISEEKLGDIVKPIYVIHGLDLTTLRIKDFDDKSIRSIF